MRSTRPSGFAPNAVVVLVQQCVFVRHTQGPVKWPRSAFTTKFGSIASDTRQGRDRYARRIDLQRRASALFHRQPACNVHLLGEGRHEVLPPNRRPCILKDFTDTSRRCSCRAHVMIGGMRKGVRAEMARVPKVERCGRYLAAEGRGMPRAGYAGFKRPGQAAY